MTYGIFAQYKYSLLINIESDYTELMPKDSEEVKRIFKSLPGQYLLLDVDAPTFTIIDASTAYLESTKTTLDRLLGKGMFEVFPDNPNDPHANGVANLSASLKYVLKYKKPHKMDIQKYDIPLSGGRFEERFWSPLNTPVLDKQNQVSHIIHAALDVTKNIQLERQEKQSRRTIAIQDKLLAGANEEVQSAKLLQAISNNATLGLFLMNDQQKCVFMNPAAEAITGFSISEIKERNCPLHDIIHHTKPDGSPFPIDECPIDSALPQQNHTQGEDKFVKKDGTFYSVAFTASPISENGRPVGTVIELRDTSEDKKAEEELRESETRFRSLADTTPMYLAMADETGSAVYFNKPWLEYTGKKLEDMVGLGWISTLHPKDAPKFEADFKHAFSEKIPINKQYRFRRADGEYRWMLAVGAPRLTSNGRFIGYYGTYTDFHDLKIAQLEIQENEARFRTLANNITQLVWTTDKTGNAKWYNQRWYDYTGKTFEETQDLGWEVIHHPKHRKRVIEGFLHCLQTGETWEDTFPLRGKNGKYRWFLSRAIPIRDKTGTITHWFGTSTDVDDLRRTTKRTHELEQIAAALRKQREQLVALNQSKDEFISLASHQLRTPATGVKQYLGMVLEGFAGDITDVQEQFLQTAYESNERQLKIVNDLLRVARVDSGKIKLQREKVNVVKMIKEIVHEQASKFEEKKQTIDFVHTHPALSILVDKGLFRMALENLIDNAHKYTYSGKKIEVIATENQGTIEIAVKDEGTGIAEHDMDKLFKKFSRVDNPLSVSAGGTGLGLYWVKRVIDLHEGAIKVQSKIENGTTFTIHLSMK